jgi:Family of unknown function (DUF6492)
MHRAWHRSSAELVGLERREYFGSDYIGNLVTWRRDVVLALQRRIEEVSGVRWDKAVCRKRDISEYILYGVFVEHQLGLHAARLAPTSDDLVHAGWHYDLTAEIGVQDFAKSLSSRHVGVAIQSTEALTLHQRRLLVEEMVSHLKDEPGNSQFGATDL